MSTSEYLVPLSDLLGTDQLPDELGFVKTGLDSLFSKLFFRDLRIFKSPSGDSANYQLTLITYRRMGIEVGSTGLAFVINPDEEDGTRSALPIEFGYRWGILGLVNDYDLSDFTEGPTAWFDLLTDVLGLDPRDLFENVLLEFVDATDPIKQYVEDFDRGVLSFDPETDEVTDLIDEIVDLGFDIGTLIMDDFILTESTLSDQLEALKRVFLQWLGEFDWDRIKDLLIPQVYGELKDLSVALEFPRNWLVPVDPDTYERIEDETIKSRLSYEIGALKFTSWEGIEFKKEASFNFQAAEILGTGLILEVEDLQVDLSDKTNIAAADAEDRPVSFKGISIESATIVLPKSWEKNEDAGRAKIVASDILIGNEGGFSGSLTLDTTDSSVLAFDLPGESMLRLDSFDLTFFQNTVESVSIAGGLTIAGLKDDTGEDALISIEIGYEEGVYSISADTSGDGLVLNFAGVTLTISAFALSFDKNGIVESAISGSLAIEGLKDKSGDKAEIDFTLEVSNNGFSIHAEAEEGVTLTAPEVLDVTIYMLEVGRKDGVTYLELASDFEILIDAPIIGKYIPDKLSIQNFYLDSTGKVEDVEVSAEWSELENAEFSASADGVSMRLPINATIGEALTVSAIEIGLYKAATSGLDLEILLSGGLLLGPVSGSVTDVGIAAHLDYNEEGADIGPLEVGLAFVPPAMIGLSIDTEIVKGGGTIGYFEDEKRYVGSLELSIKETISVKAIAVLDLENPDGEKTFSLLVAISAEFQPIQLGYGFTLNGVGGLLGTNRTMLTDVIRDGLKDGALDSLLFPENVVEDMDNIVSDLTSVFPVEDNQYIFGPMGKFGWGTPTLLTIELGILLELARPTRLAIVGVLGLVLPDEDLALAQIKVGFIGEIDFQRKMLAFDASLYDSFVLTWTLYGDMALRLTWGENPNFLLTVGGFHPDYTPPSLSLPELRRLTVNLLTGDSPRLTLQAYFALTSNSVQFGASIDFYYQATKKIYIEGYLGFDALFQFSPFWFKISIGASLAVMKKGIALMSIYLGGSLEGPTPWRVAGCVEFKVLGIPLKVKIDKTFGKADSTTFPDISVTSELVAAVEDIRNWMAESTSRNGSLVTTNEVSTEDEEMVADPTGKIGLSQKVVPLETRIELFGNKKPRESDPEWELRLYNSDGDLLTSKTVKEAFAPAQFFSQSEAQKITGKSFEQMNGGIEAEVGSELEGDFFLEREVEYDQSILDTGKTSGSKKGLDKGFALGLTRRNASSRSALGKSKQLSSVLGSAQVFAPTESFVVVSAADLSPFGEVSTLSKTEADLELAAIVAANPLLKNELQVIPTYELV